MPENIQVSTKDDKIDVKLTNIGFTYPFLDRSNETPPKQSNKLDLTTKKIPKVNKITYKAQDEADVSADET